MNTASLGYFLDVTGSASALRRGAIAASRPLQFALLVSALLHAFALGWLPGLERMSSVTPLPLRILLPPISPAPAPVATVATPAPQVPVPRNVAATPATAAASPAPPPVAVPLHGDDASPARVALPMERPASATPVEAPVASAVPSSAFLVDAQALAGYGRSVAGAVAVHQRYPRIAQMRQWQGTTTLQLEFAADGRLLETRVLSSSGHDVLDHQALDMVRAARPLPPLPPALAGRALTVNVPVVFRLAG